jgi:rare lipoprotein A (peptidoglycan hydrolase)
MLVAGPALVGQQQRITGTLGSAARGRTIAVQAQAPGAAWATIATTRADADGSFATSWRAATTGRWPIRALPEGDALAAVAGGTPTATAIVYRGATATWYSMPGNRTACGVRLRRTTMGVAHRTLPCGTRVDVTWGGRSVSVPVIDRGPFVAGVHYDLTLAAAKLLGFVSAGRVRVGVLPAGRTLAASPLSANPPALAGGGVTRP